MDRFELMERALCEKSYYDFLKAFWGEVITEPIQDNWHIKYLCDELESIGERIINREAKSYD